MNKNTHPRVLRDRYGIARRTTPIVACIVAATSIAGCQNSSTSPTQTSVPFYGVVSGRVTLASGVANARVTSVVYRESCASGNKSGSGSPTTELTDASGIYRQQVISLVVDPTSCVQVSVARPGTDAPVASAQSSAIHLKPRNADSVADTVRVDVRLP